jgi:hypothetical protein
MHTMRAISIAVAAGLLATGALAQSIVSTQAVPDFQERIGGCIAEWNTTTTSERGTMSYRVFITKCLQGKLARPINAVAECRNGTTAPATAPEGACAFDGGVNRWVQ